MEDPAHFYSANKAFGLASDYQREETPALLWFDLARFIKGGAPWVVETCPSVATCREEAAKYALQKWDNVFDRLADAPEKERKHLTGAIKRWIREIEKKREDDLLPVNVFETEVEPEPMTKVSEMPSKEVYKAVGWEVEETWKPPQTKVGEQWWQLSDEERKRRQRALLAPGKGIVRRLPEEQAMRARFPELFRTFRKAELREMRARVKEEETADVIEWKKKLLKDLETTT